MSGLSPERLAEIEARLGRATWGPWRAIGSNQGHPAGYEWEVYAPVAPEIDHTGWVCRESDLAHCEDGGICFTDVGGRRDAEFIAAARTDIPDLLAEVKQLRAQAEDEAVCRQANSASARALMDAIREDPAFPPDDDPALFGERALAVINRLRAQIAAIAELLTDYPQCEWFDEPDDCSTREPPRGLTCWPCLIRRALAVGL